MPPAFCTEKSNSINIEALCAALPEALDRSPSQMPLNCAVVPPYQRELLQRRRRWRWWRGEEGARATRAPKARSCATSCGASSAAPSVTFFAASLTCSSFTCHLRAGVEGGISVLWVPPLEDSACHDEYLHAPVLRGLNAPVLHVSPKGKRRGRHTCSSPLLLEVPSPLARARLPEAAARRRLCAARARAEIWAQLGSSVAFGSGCWGEVLPGVPRKALLQYADTAKARGGGHGAGRGSGRGAGRGAGRGEARVGRRGGGGVKVLIFPMAIFQPTPNTRFPPPTLAFR